MQRLHLNKKRIALIIALVIGIYFYVGLASPKQTEWGVTFTPAYAESFGFEWEEVYLAMLDDLQVDHLRIPAYWTDLEPQQGEFDFSRLDFQVQEASKRKVEILLVVGRRLPRWPECHIPEWAKDLPEAQQQEAVLTYIPQVINRYKDNPDIKAWQVENEFFLRGFGECPEADSEFFDRELALVRSLDDRPIVTTDSGELGGWIGSVRRGDIFGTTMYRIVYNDMFGFITYPLRPIFYKRRFLLYKPFFRAKKIINVELQAEPWGVTNLVEDPLETQYQTMSPEQFVKNIDFARRSGISPAYLWGAEWWYYMKESRGVEDFWEQAKNLWEDEKSL